MRYARLACLWALCFAVTAGCSDSGGSSEAADAATPGGIETLARCLTNEGWVMYSSFTCGVCRVQKELFADAARYIQTVECHPNADYSQSERCLEKKIRKTPTWIRERDDEEFERLVGYQSLDVLAAESSCPDPAGG